MIRLKKKTTCLFAILISIVMVATTVLAAGTNAEQAQTQQFNTNSGQTYGQPSSATYESISPSTVRILIYADDAYHPFPNTYIDQALRNLGLGYTAHYDSDFAGFNTNLTTRGPWNLVIFGDENWPPDVGTFTNLNNYVNSGGKLIARTWVLSSHAGNPLWNTMGVTWISDDYDPPDPVHWWNPGHPILNGVPSFTRLTSGRYGVYGQRLQPLSTATALGGYTTSSSPNQAALILRNDDKTLFMGFMDGQNDADLDTDGVRDNIELWQNAINYMLGGSTAQVNVRISPESQEVITGQRFNVSIVIEPQGNPVAGAQSNLVFNRNLINANSVAEGNFLRRGGATFFNPGVIDNGTGRINDIYGAALYPGGVTQTGIFANITMTAVATSDGISPVTLDGVVVSNPSGVPYRVNISNGEVRVRVCDAVWDVNRDGVTNIQDIVIVGQHFGERTSPPYPLYDVNRDGVVNIQDIVIIGQHFGERTCWAR